MLKRQLYQIEKDKKRAELDRQYVRRAISIGEVDPILCLSTVCKWSKITEPGRDKNGRE